MNSSSSSSSRPAVPSAATFKAAADAGVDWAAVEALCCFSKAGSSPDAAAVASSPLAAAAATSTSTATSTTAALSKPAQNHLSAAPAIFPALPALKIQCDPPSSKARFKCYPTLVRLCSRYSRSPTDHHISVCEGRKTVHVLNDGEVDHVACFIGNETPGASFRVRKTAAGGANKSEMQSSYLRSIVVPNGWKVAVVDEGHLFTAEARVSAESVMEYRFASVNERGEEENLAHWYSNLCEAFRKVSQPLEDKKTTKTHRYNGKLLLGLHYHNPQLKVQQFVRKQFAEGKFDSAEGGELKQRVAEWLANCDQERLRGEAAQPVDGGEEADAKRQRL